MSFQEKLTNSINETVLTCLFDFRPCLPSEFTWYRHSDVGICLKFETKRKIHFQGTTNGFKIELLLEPDDNNLSKEHKYHNGLDIKISNTSVSAIISKETIVSSHNKLINIAVSRAYNKKLPMPYNDCVDDGVDHSSLIYRTTLGLNHTYSQK